MTNIDYYESIPLNQLSAFALSELLKAKPEYASRCDFSKLNGEAWSSLLSVRPEFADRCDWDKLNHSHWITLLSNQPQFLDNCNRDKLDFPYVAWNELLAKHLNLWIFVHLLYCGQEGILRYFSYWQIRISQTLIGTMFLFGIGLIF